MPATAVICPACKAALTRDDPLHPGVALSLCPKCGESVSLLSVPTAESEPDHPAAVDPPVDRSSSAVVVLESRQEPTDGTSVSPPSPPELPFLAPPQQTDEIGRLGAYRVLRLLGQGGMGAVFLVEDPALQRQLALKVLLPQHASSAEAKARFVREAKAQAAVEHDHVVTIHHIGEDRGVPFLAMPLLKGQTLGDALQANPQVPIAEAVRIARETAEGLAAAHERRLIHRDVKPGNLWLEGSRRRVKVLDFGLARPPSDSEPAGLEPVTQTGAVVGTPAYMSPEQARGERVDARTDLFSLGCVLYQMLTSRRPFTAPNVTGVLIAVTTETPPRPRTLNPSVTPELDALVMRLLAKNPAERPPSAEAVVEELRLVEAGLGVTGMVSLPLDPIPMADPWEVIEPTEADPSAIAAPAETPGRRKPRRWVWVGLVLAFLAVGAVAAQIIIKIRNKDGTETEIKVPDGATVEVTKDGKPVAKLGPGLPKTGDLAKASDLLPGEKIEPFEYVFEGEKKQGTRRVLTLDIGGGETMEFVHIPKGAFLMGAPDTEKGAKADEKPQRRVEITQDFYMGKYEVTQTQYKALTGADPSSFKGGRRPVERVTWEEAVACCETLSGQVKRKVELPTEAQWEYACRAGTTTPFHFGSKLNGDLANCLGDAPYGTEVKGVTKKSTVVVGSYPANPWGLHDMHGNAWEWCRDYYGPYDKIADLKDPFQSFQQSQNRRVLRGGSHSSTAGGCRAAVRHLYQPDSRRDGYAGFRVSFSISEPTAVPDPDRKAPDNATAGALRIAPVEKTETFEYVIEGEKKTGVRRVLTLDIGGGETMEFVRIPKGTFLMGAPDGEKGARNDEKPQRRVEISRDFYLGKFEVTQAQYRAVTGLEPSKSRGDRLPVDSVSWDDAIAFCSTLSGRVKRTIELPTEAQWEYACRAGTTTPFHFGSKLNGDLANCNSHAPYGTEVQGAFQGQSVEVGSYPANPWGLYDMHGNLWEWCRDHHGPYDKLTSLKDPFQSAPQLQERRVLRGGSWGGVIGASDCRAAFRNPMVPGLRGNIYGFRVCFRID
jgi:formylglycine-generating enzyme required for sulfatase activity/serine/threonine protein kinase